MLKRHKDGCWNVRTDTIILHVNLPSDYNIVVVSGPNTGTQEGFNNSVIKELPNVRSEVEKHNQRIAAVLSKEKLKNLKAGELAIKSINSTNKAFFLSGFQTLSYDTPNNRRSIIGYKSTAMIVINPLKVIKFTIIVSDTLGLTPDHEQFKKADSIVENWAREFRQLNNL